MEDEIRLTKMWNGNRRKGTSNVLVVARLGLQPRMLSLGFILLLLATLPQGEYFYFPFYLYTNWLLVLVPVLVPVPVPTDNP